MIYAVERVVTVYYGEDIDKRVMRNILGKLTSDLERVVWKETMVRT